MEIILRNNSQTLETSVLHRTQWKSVNDSSLQTLKDSKEGLWSFVVYLEEIKHFFFLKLKENTLYNKQAI